MNKNKIDDRLFYSIHSLENDKKVEFFVHGNDFFEIKNLLERKNVQILSAYLFINSFFCLAKKEKIFDLSMQNEVIFVSSNPVANSLMHIARRVLGCDKTRLTGCEVGVAFIDTGITNQMDFLIGRNRIKVFKDFINNKTECYDDNGHGTFIAGVCAGSGVRSKQKYVGVAPHADIISLKALNQNGEANASKILDAMQWIFENHKKQNIKIVCMSFGSEPLGSNDPIMMGADALWDEGVVVVAAAGNSGPEFQTIKSPGISSKIITVGGIDDKRLKERFTIADFSSRGPAMKRVKPDVVAPSVDIISCDRNGGYTHISGTSVAAPMIAGLSALLLEKDKNLTPNQIKLIFKKNSRSIGFGENEEGFGLPNFSKIL